VWIEPSSVNILWLQYCGSAAIKTRLEPARYITGEGTVCNVSPVVRLWASTSSVAEPHHFYATPAPGKNFDAAPAPAPAPTQLYNKAKFLKRTKVKQMLN
jgi:hypothetical protein